MLAKIPPSKTDTYRVILLKNLTVFQKQRNKTQTLIKKRPSRLSTKRRKKEEKKRQTLKSKPYIQIRILSSRLWLPPLRCNSIATQIRIPCSRSASIQKKKFQKEAKKKGSVRLLQKGKLKNLVRPLQKQAIQKIIQKVGMFFSPFFCFLFNYRF